ncbi:hypothetical protein FNV43_RR14858 [Rhamnella rubrinervis]|uniref:Uncharacterized protein n=1 Tax=Rhamnella rubrinervis TaxID=2594499 RepID=A0A8K0H3S2_9ROSA|nr:hypothetical protein FNV43_RR14858 [Rhamnella rubrinervis]
MGDSKGNCGVWVSLIRWLLKRELGFQEGDDGGKALVERKENKKEFDPLVPHHYIGGEAPMVDGDGIGESVYPSMNMSFYKFELSEPRSTSYYDVVNAYEVNDHEPRSDE